MKKVFSVLCVVIILSTFTACGDTEKVKAKLVGKWVGSSDLFSITYDFHEDGTYYKTHTVYLWNGTTQEYGSYKIRSGEIVMTTSENKEGDVLKYVYNKDDGSLTISSHVGSNGTTFKKMG